MSHTTSTDPLVLHEQISAPIESVFDFLVDPGKLSRWMGAVDVDARPGGHFQLDVGENRAVGEYVDVEPPHRVSFTWGWLGHDAVPPGTTLVTITLTSTSEGNTLVELRHDGLPLGPADEHKGGWTQCLDRLPYAVARESLLDAELELMAARERVAEQRRTLPLGPVIDNYTFTDANGPVSLVDLFTAPDRTLVLYHFMFGKSFEQPCPMCAMWADGWNGVAEQLRTRVDFVIVTSASPEENAELATRREWDALRLVSAADTTFKADIGGEDTHGNQMPYISSYRLTADGPQLTYSGGAHLRDDQWRGLDLLSPVWHILDLTPEGRGDWMPKNR